MARFLLIHGSAHGAWCWRDVVPALSALGHDVRAIDLPGSGADMTPVGEVTMDSYAEAIVQHLDGPTILVGHSAGGLAIAAAAEKAPDKVAALVYLAAYVPADGKSLVDLLGEADEQPLKTALDMAADRKSFRFRPDALEEKLYHDCPPGTVDYARALLGWQALKPQVTPMVVTEASAARPAHVIVTLRDRAVPPAHQRQMAGDLPVHEMNSGHSPFFAAPEALSTVLSRIADAT